MIGLPFTMDVMKILRLLGSFVEWGNFHSVSLVIFNIRTSALFAVVLSSSSNYSVINFSHSRLHRHQEHRTICMSNLCHHQPDPYSTQAFISMLEIGRVTLSQPALSLAYVIGYWVHPPWNKQVPRKEYSWVSLTGIHQTHPAIITFKALNMKSFDFISQGKSHYRILKASLCTSIKNQLHHRISQW